MALLVYDYVVTLPDEIDLVWHSPRSTANAIFFLHRYTLLLFCLTFTTLMLQDHPTERTCQAAFDLQAWSTWVCSFLTGVLLMFWVNAIYQLNHVYRVAMLVTFAAMSSATAIALGVELPRIDASIEMPACSLNNVVNSADLMGLLWRQEQQQQRTPSHMMFAYLIPSAVYELVLLGLLIRKAIHLFQAGGSRCDGTALGFIFMRDSIIYLIIIFVVYVINAIIWTYAPRPLFQLGVGFGISLPCILGSRLLLNLRGAYRGRRQFTATDLLLRSSRWDHLFHGNESGAVLQPEPEPELEQEVYSDDNNNMQEVDHHHDRDDDHDRPLAGQSCCPCPSRLSRESGICEGMGIAV